MIAVTLEGRLGNQLFQYAFIYAAARRLNTSFYIDKSTESYLLPRYFEIKNDFLIPLDRYLFSIPGYKNIFRIHSKKAFYQLINNIIFNRNKIAIDNALPIADALQLVKNGYQFNGYFQSQSYFEDFKNEIRKLFTIKKIYTDAFKEVNQQLSNSKKKVVIHVRVGDYVGLNFSVPVTYYKKVIDLIGDTDTEYIFISDDTAFVEKQFSYIANKYISRNSEIVDFQFLMHAEICILSNSSFSWWGAWLNNNPNKKLFAPKYWLGFKDKIEYPAGIADNLDINWIEV